MSQTLLFDVDGTLAETFDKAADIVEDLAAKFNYVAPEDRRKLRRIDWQELPTYLGVSRFRRRRFKRTFLERLRAAMSDARLSRDLDGVLKIITVSGYPVGAMTSSSVTNFESLAKENNYFSMTDLGDYDVNKSRVLKDFISRFGLAPTEVVYVGDEVEDIEAAKSLGMTSVGAAWGLTHEIELKKHEPDFIVNKPEELLTVLSQLDD